MSLIFILAILPSMLFVQHACSGQAAVAWTADTDTAVTGYTVGYGTSTGNYTNTLNAGNTTTATLPSLSSSPYYIAVAAYDANNNKSSYSSELVVEPLTATAGTGGSISPSGSFFETQGSSQTFTITPTTGYQVSGVTVDGVSVGAVTTYTISNITGSHTVAATFAAATTSYTITATAGANGSISPSGAVTVNSGASQSFTITPASGCHVSTVTVDGASVGAVTSYTFSNVTATHTIAATFATAAKYTITATAGANGSISPSGAVSVSSGGSQSFTITPASGYHVSGVSVDGASVGAVTSYTFSNVTATHTIAATFAVAATSYTITATKGTGALLTPSGTITVKSGGSLGFSIGTASNYYISEVIVDGVSVGAVINYKFTNVTANHSISVICTTQRSTGAATGAALSSTAVADAGPAQTVAEGSTVTLSGLNSTDAGGPGIASYSWVQTGGTSVVLSNPHAASTNFSAPSWKEGALNFSLTVTDKNGLNSTSACIVNVVSNTMPPVANAGPDQTVGEWTIVTLNGSQSSGDISSYNWKQIDGPPVAISDPTLAQPTFVAPLITNGVPASMSFMLTVTDSSGLATTDICFVNVTWTDLPPQAIAGFDLNANAGSVVMLDGSKSRALSGVAGYRWQQIEGAPVTLSSPISESPEFTAKSGAEYGNTLTFRLILTDTTGMRSRANGTVNVKSVNTLIIGSF